MVCTGSGEYNIYTVCIANRAGYVHSLVYGYVELALLNKWMCGMEAI